MIRAPILVAIAMIEYGANVEETIKLLRKLRPGSLNLQQTSFLMKYKSNEKNTKSCCLTF